MNPIVEFFTQRQDVVYRYFLGFVFVVFISILVGTYFVARKANPVLLDEHGVPVRSGPQRK